MSDFDEKTLRLKKKYRSIFDSVVSRYQAEELNQTNISVTNRYARLSEQHNHTQYNSRIVKCSSTDFIADVEITARQNLTKAQFSYFRKVFLHNDTDARDAMYKSMSSLAYQDFNIHIKETVGAAFKENKLHPFSHYFKSTVVKRSSS